MIRVFIQNKKYINQIQYVFNTVFFILGIKCIYVDAFDELIGLCGAPGIAYCSSEFELAQDLGKVNNLISIKDSGKLFGSQYLKPCSIPLKTRRYKECGAENISSDIISIYSDDEPLYISRERGKNTIRTNIDIISDIFFMLTRYEEVVRLGDVKKDRYDRFPAMETLSCRDNFLHRPVVNEHIELLRSWIESLSAGYEKVNWWGQKDFAVFLSHDVDHIVKNKNLPDAAKHALAIILRFGKIKKAFNYLCSYFKNRSDHKKDPYWTFNYILNIEKKYGFNSSFYFMALEASDPDFRYDIGDERVRELVRELEANGCEVGYHGSLCSFNNKLIMEKEKRRLDGIVRIKNYGCRQHYLRFQVPYTWRCQQRLSLLYDTTLAFAERAGFRCGICFPYKPYDILEDRVLDIWEIPLIVMEGTLQSAIYENLPPEEGLKKLKYFIDKVKRYKGVFSLLWHNSSFDYNWEGWGRIFEETVKYLSESNCLGLTGREIIELMSRYSD